MLVLGMKPGDRVLVGDTWICLERSGINARLSFDGPAVVRRERFVPVDDSLASRDKSPRSED